MSLKEQKDFIINATEYEILKNEPSKIVQCSCSKKNAKKLLLALLQSNLSSIKLKKKNKDNIFEKYKIFSCEQILSQFSNVSHTSQLLRKILKKRLLMYENVGYFYRENFWLIASDVKYIIQENKDYYSCLQKNFKEYSDYFKNLIELDLSRTNERFFQEEELASKCRNILINFSKRNPDIGYCQGMNFVAWEISKRKFSEEEAFWFFTILIENFMPIDYYSSMVGVLVDQKIFNILISELLPAVFAKFKELSFDTSLFSVQWFVCIYCKSLNHLILDLVFDNLIIQGSIALFKIGLSILKLLQNEILKANDFANLLHLIDIKTKEIRDTILFQQTINEFYICPKLIDISRKFFQSQVEQEQFAGVPFYKYSKKIYKVNVQSKLRIKESKQLCNTNSLVCRTLVEFNQVFKTNFSSFVLRQHPALLNIDSHYFENESLNKLNSLGVINMSFEDEIKNIQNSIDPNEYFNNILIGRHHHICKEKDDFDDSSPFSPFSPFSPYSPFSSGFNGFADSADLQQQRQKNKGLLKEYLKKSVDESRKSLNKNEKKTKQIHHSHHSKTIAISGKTEYNHENNNEFIDSPMTATFGFPIKKEKEEFLQVTKSGEMNFKKRKPERVNTSFEFSKRFSMNCDIDTMPRIDLFHDKKSPVVPIEDTILESLNSSKSPEKDDNLEDDNSIRNSFFLLQSKGVCNFINEDVINKYEKIINNSESFNFTNKYFNDRLNSKG